MTASSDPDITGDPEAATTEVLMYAMGLAAERRANPREDIVTTLVHADMDGCGTSATVEVKSTLLDQEEPWATSRPRPPRLLHVQRAQASSTATDVEYGDASKLPQSVTMK